MKATHIIVNHHNQATYPVANVAIDGNRIRADYFGCLTDDGCYSKMETLGGSWRTEECTVVALGQRSFVAADLAHALGTALERAAHNVTCAENARLRADLDAVRSRTRRLRAERGDAERERDVTCAENARLRAEQSDDRAALRGAWQQAIAQRDEARAAHNVTLTATATLRAALDRAEAQRDEARANAQKYARHLTNVRQALRNA